MPAEEVKEQYIVKSTRDPIKIPELTLSEYLYQKISAQDPERIALVSKLIFFLKLKNLQANKGINFLCSNTFRSIHRMEQN